MEQKWISTKDRLPEDETPVIFFQLYKDKKSGVVKMGTFWPNALRKKPCFTTTNSLSYLDEGLVTHWMNQPEDPKP